MNSNKKKIIAGVIISALTITMGVSVFAANAFNRKAGGGMQGKSGMEQNFMGNRGMKDNGKGNMFRNITDSGVLTEEEVESIQAYFEEKSEEMKEARKNGERPERIQGRSDIFAELVESDILTQDRADEIKVELEMLRDENEKNMLSNKLDTLVSEGIIVETHVEKILEFMTAEKEEIRAEREALKEEIEGMTVEERKEYFENNKPEKANVFDKMVDEGIISQDTCDNIKEEFKGQNFPKVGEGMFGNITGSGILTEEETESMQAYFEEKSKEMKEARKNGERPERIQGRSDIFAELVESGILTQDRADVIKVELEISRDENEKNILSNKLNTLVSEGIIVETDVEKILEFMTAEKEEVRAEREALKEEIEGMTVEERKEYFENNKLEKVNVFDKMVNEGIISQDTCDNIKKEFKGPNFPKSGDGVQGKSGRNRKNTGKI